MYNTFPRKAYGRIFVEKPEDVEKVKSIIKQMDEFEYEYLPDDFIVPFSVETASIGGKQEYVMRLQYTHKFDNLDLNELQFRCWAFGIKVFCCMQGGTEDCWFYPVWETD